MTSESRKMSSVWLVLLRSGLFHGECAQSCCSRVSVTWPFSKDEQIASVSSILAFESKDMY